MTKEPNAEGSGPPPPPDLEGGVPVYDVGKRLAQEQRRAWRAKERAANLRPLSTRVVHRGGRVDAGPKAKPKGKGK
jgi:hypothetical protein